jgi:hypothetical protein
MITTKNTRNNEFFFGAFSPDACPPGFTASFIVESLV